MTQYDLILTQNVHATLVEYSEKRINVAKGDLISSDVNGTPTVLAGGTDGYQLVRDNLAATGLKWQAIPSLSQLHNQNEDTGTNSVVFELDTDGYKIELTAESASKFGVKVDGGATYADLQAKDATFASASVSAAPTIGNHLTNKTYVDGLLSANDAMVFKGTVGTGGTLEIAAFNSLATYQAGWSYKVITAGTIKGKVCEIGDMVVASMDRGGSGNIDGDFLVLQTNADGLVIGPASTTDNFVALFDGISGKLLKAGSGALGTAAYTASTAYATSTQGTTADNAIPKAILDAETILYATVNDTPAALAVAASTIVGRKASGSISAMNATEARTVLNVADGATNNTKATGAEINTGTDDAKFVTPKAMADSNNIMGPGSSVADRIALFNGTTGKLLKDGAKLIGDLMRTWVTAPASKTATGVVGDAAYDSNYLYVCTATNTWKRIQIATNW